MSNKADAVSATEMFQRFVAAMNGHDVEALTSLMTSDHLFVDSMGDSMQGVESMQTGCAVTLRCARTIGFRVRSLLSERETVLATGEAGETIDGIAWRTPTAWQAVLDSHLTVAALL
jgi:ketosteroid isomerase-like protein